MLTRAVSAPAKYSSPGILRYGGCSFDNETNSPVSVSFAPLPVPDPDPGSRRHKYKMGVQGRTGILNKQRQHTNGINYRPPPGGGMILSSTAAAAAKQKTNNASDPHTDTSISGKGDSSSSKEPSSLVMSRGDLSLRRTASEDGTANTLSLTHNGGTGFKFWRKTFHAASKRPGLSTVPSEDTMLVTSGTTNNDTTEPAVDLEGRDDVVKPVKTISVNKDISDHNVQDELLDVRYPDIRRGPSCPEEPEDVESKNPELAEKLRTSNPS
ncbi:hypothetical protein FRC19_006280 [Serendipita sp. 401]|nr:hypothetical protein FRC19_006280 [Serendipita sp. 401]